MNNDNIAWWENDGNFAEHSPQQLTGSLFTTNLDTGSNRWNSHVHAWSRTWTEDGDMDILVGLFIIWNQRCLV